MRHFYRVLQNQLNIPLMTEIMRKQDEVFAAGAVLPLDAKKMALAIMQVTNGTALLGAELLRLEHDQKLPISHKGDPHYIAVLNGQVMCIIENECPAMNPGDVWWFNADAIFINKSGDDAILLHVVTKVDE